jgi:hypothetical protein
MRLCSRLTSVGSAAAGCPARCPGRPSPRPPRRHARSAPKSTAAPAPRMSSSAATSSPSGRPGAFSGAGQARRTAASGRSRRRHPHVRCGCASRGRRGRDRSVPGSSHLPWWSPAAISTRRLSISSRMRSTGSTSPAAFSDTTDDFGKKAAGQHVDHLFRHMVVQQTTIRARLAFLLPCLSGWRSSTFGGAGSWDSMKIELAERCSVPGGINGARRCPRCRG